MIKDVKFMKIPTTIDFSKSGMDLAEVFVLSGLTESKTKFRNFVKERAIRVHDTLVTDPFARICIFEESFVVMERENVGNTL